MVKIISVCDGSRAMRAGVLSGDILVSINGHEIIDVLDYRFYLAERVVELVLLRGEKEISLSISKRQYDDIGLEFETPLMDKKQTCKNKCIFCFIDQNPKGMRDTIYFKDDDSRLSFIHGNYITLTNLSEREAQRIVEMRFSPINISIHTTNPELRVKMMKNKNSGDVLRYLDTFHSAGIKMCGQIVLCKGVNDGSELLRSMRDLSRYFPSLSSVSIVPAGLTKHREGLYPLTDFDAQEAAAVIDMIDGFAQRHLEEHGSRLFFAADEFYLKAGRELPSEEYYEDYPQIENGVGMLRSFEEELTIALRDAEELTSELEGERRVTVVTGYAAYKMLSAAKEKIEALTDKVKIDLRPIKNKFFGESITVSGLLTGKDIKEQLIGTLTSPTVIIPSSALRHPDEDFLCGMTLSELSDELGAQIITCGGDGFDFVDAVFGRE